MEQGMGRHGAAQFVELCKRLWPKADMTPEEWAVLQTRVVRYDFEQARAAVCEVRAQSRSNRPNFHEVLRALGTATFGKPEDAALRAAEKIRQMFRETDEENVREKDVAETIHIPALERLGRDECKRRRDGLIARMSEDQRNKAKAPTWEQLTSMEGDCARLRCWRYWIIMDSFDAYSPELAHV